MSGIAPEKVADLQRQIAERAQVYMDSPEKRPAGFAIVVGRRGGLEPTSPYALLEACLAAAAKEIAPDFDHQMARYMAHPPELLLGLYRGER